MGLFDMFSEYKQSNEKNNFPWIPLKDVVQLDEIRQKTDLVVIFKHSTRCGISRSVLDRFEKKYQDKVEGIKYYYLDLLNQRPLSAEIATRFKILHQSPQLIVIENEKVKVHASHYDILDVDLHL